MHVVRQVWTMTTYGPSAVRVAVRARKEGALLGHDDRLVFVVGSPRSGTTFTARTLGEQPGVVDLGEVRPLKAALPGLVDLPADEQATTLRRILDRFRRFAFVQHLRGVGPPRRARRPRRGLLAARAGLAERRPRGSRRRGSGIRRAPALLGRARAARRVRAGQRRAARRLGMAPLRHVRPAGSGRAHRRAPLRGSRRGSRRRRPNGSEPASISTRACWRRHSRRRTRTRSAAGGRT
jgi:hypothetical protein